MIANLGTYKTMETIREVAREKADLFDEFLNRPFGARKRMETRRR